MKDQGTAEYAAEMIGAVNASLDAAPVVEAVLLDPELGLKVLGIKAELATAAATLALADAVHRSPRSGPSPRAWGGGR